MRFVGIGKLVSVLVSTAFALSSCGSSPISPEVQERNRKWEAYYENYKREHPTAPEGEVLCQTNKQFGSLRSCPGSSSIEDMYDQMVDQAP